MSETLRIYGNQCPTCGKPTHVTDSRALVGGIRRRRECANKHRFTTYELMRPASSAPLRLLDEDFDEIRSVVERVLRRANRLNEILEDEMQSKREADHHD